MLGGGHGGPPGRADRRSGRCARGARHRDFSPGSRRFPPCPPPAAFGRDSGGGVIAHLPPPRPPSPPFLSHPLPAAAGGCWGPGRGDRCCCCSFPLCQGAWGISTLAWFFLGGGGDFETPPNLCPAPRGRVLVPGAAGTPMCPHPWGEGVWGEGTKALTCYGRMFWGGFGHFWVHPPQGTQVEVLPTGDMGTQCPVPPGVSKITPTCRCGALLLVVLGAWCPCTVLPKP